MALSTDLQHPNIIRGEDIEPLFPHGSIISAFDLACAGAPNQIALTKSHITFRELQLRTLTLAQQLCELGATTDSRIGLLLPTSDAQILGLLAVLRSGATYVPLDVYSPVPYAFTLAELADCTIIVADKDIPEAIAYGIPTIVLDADCLASGDAQNETTLAAPAELFCNPPAQTACILFTSGTTGKPKGVPLSANAILTRISWWMRLYPMQEGDTFLSQLSAHTLGGTMAPLTGLLQRCGVLALDRDELLAVQAGPLASRQLPLSDVLIMPSLVEQFIQNSLSLPNLKRLVLTGEHCSDTLLQTIFQTYPDAQVITLYGLTECAGHALAYSYTGAETTTRLGIPSDNIIAWLLNEDLTLAEPGESGLLYLSGRGITERYLDPNMAQPTVFEPKSGTVLLETNDVVRRDEDGYLHYVGRRDRQVKIRGFRVDLNHVENLLTNLPEIRRAAVLYGHEQMSAFIIPHQLEDSATLSAQQPAHSDSTVQLIRQSISESVPQWAIPHRVELVETLPLTDTQKVNYKALKARLLPASVERNLGEELTQSPEPLPSTQPLVGRIVEAYKHALNVDSISSEDDFFQVGGDSFSVLRLVEELRSIGLTPQQIYEHRTPAQLTQVLAQENGDTDRFSNQPDFEQVPVAMFAAALMGYAYVEKVPKWILARAIPWLQRRFYLAILERAILLTSKPDPANVESKVQSIGQLYPIFRAKAVNEEGFWASHLQVSNKPLGLMVTDPDGWESLRKELRRRLSIMTEELVYFVLVDRVLYILAHHSVCDYYTLNQLARLLGRDEPITAQECRELRSIHGFEEWRNSQEGLLQVPEPIEELVLPQRKPSWAIVPRSRRACERMEIQSALTHRHRTDVRVRTYVAWLTALYRLYGQTEMTFHEVVDLRSMPWLPYQFANTMGLMAGICRLNLEYDPSIGTHDSIAFVKEQLSQQLQMRNIWQQANWQMATCLERTWIFNFMPTPTNLDVRFQDRPHPPLGPTIQMQRTIECYVHIHQECLWVELIYDHLRYSRATVGEFLRQFRLEYGLVT